MSQPARFSQIVKPGGLGLAQFALARYCAPKVGMIDRHFPTQKADTTTDWAERFRLSV
jgi:hypothetical protein